MNRFELSASLAEPANLRHTPAGLAALRVKVNHLSDVVEANRPRQVTWQMEMVAFGEVAAGLARVPPGKPLKMTGFIDRKNVNQLEMHITEFGLIEE